MLRLLLVLVATKAQTVSIKNVSDMIELKAMESTNLNPQCIISPYIDQNGGNLYWISGTQPANLISNIYDNQLLQYNNSNDMILTNSLPFNVSHGSDIPDDALGFPQCTSPANNDIIMCYAGGDDPSMKKEILCAIFNDKNSTLSNTFIINNSSNPDIESVSFPQIICQSNGYVVFYLSDGYHGFIKPGIMAEYTVLDLEGNILVQDQEINAKDEQFSQNDESFFQLTAFNDSLFLLTLSFFGDGEGPIGWIVYDEIDNGNTMTIMNRSYFRIVTPPNMISDAYTTISLNVSNECCFVTMYQMVHNASYESLYVALMDINGNKITKNDYLISIVEGGSFPGGIELKMLNNDDGSQYFLIYESQAGIFGEKYIDTYLYGWVYQLSYKNRKYGLNMINNVTLQASAYPYNIEHVCLSNLNGQLLVATYAWNGSFYNVPLKMYGQLFSVSLT